MGGDCSPPRRKAEYAARTRQKTLVSTPACRRRDESILPRFHPTWPSPYGSQGTSARFGCIRSRLRSAISPIHPSGLPPSPDRWLRGSQPATFSFIVLSYSFRLIRMIIDKIKIAVNVHFRKKSPNIRRPRKAAERRQSLGSGGKPRVSEAAERRKAVKAESRGKPRKRKAAGGGGAACHKSAATTACRRASASRKPSASVSFVRWWRQRTRLQMPRIYSSAIMAA